jgi:integrase
MRLSEAAELARDDIVLNADIHHVIIPSASVETSENKRQQKRILPLVGASLWAAERAVEASQHSPYLFPRYCNNKGCEANSTSAALNKWIKQTIGDGYVMHSFHHSMRERLRAVNCPSEMIEQIGGWSKRSVGEGYGEGYSVLQTKQWMTRLLAKQN